ncbi:von Willebrand factor A-like domain superfamily [Sesbania bispinosa]|nr:von Willebrand factor A-like domain superfamily [Sesbania bispinosa]
MATLLGPPEIYTPKSTTTPTTTATAASTPSNPFMDLMVSNFNSMTTKPQGPMGLTENMSPTFLSSGNPCLDYFFHVVPDTPPEILLQRLQLAWSHHPLTTLKLVCNLRGVRGTGKSDREGFYAAALWLHDHHPKTLASNVPSLADFGYFKDLPEILYRLLEGPQARKIQKEEWQQRKRGSKKNNKGPFKRKGKQNKKKGKNDNKDKALVPRETRVMDERAKAEKENAHAAREEKRVAMAKKLVERYNRDPNFQFLHDRVSDHFAECLKKDMEFLKSGSLSRISLAAKWCPSVDSSFDRSTLLCETIAKRLFPREEYEGVEEAHYAYRVRDRLRKDVLVPLRKVLELPEVFIGANRWDLIPYNRVASVAMEFYKEKFLKHDKDRFEKYLDDVRSGKATIAAGALLPHQIIGSLGDGDGGEVAELQWKRMVDDLLKKGKMKNCLAVCDVSGSMSGIPMEVSVALGLLVSELSEEPWKGKVITFSERPELHLIEGDDLQSKTEFVRNMDWGMNTDFQMVFDLMLEVAVNGNLKADQMIKRVFVFSDMEFDQASLNPWETDYQAITRKYSEKGYGSAVPQIVFWNLRDSRATPVPATQKGVALVSGFSKNLLTLFLDNDGDISPEEAMEAAISGPEYQKLVVLD